MMQPSDKTLIRRAKQGDRAAFDALYQKYEKRIFNYIYRMVGSYEMAEDLAQESFVKAYMNLSNFREQSAFATWVYAIAGNLVKNEFRARAYRAEVSMDRLLVVDDNTLRLIDVIADKSSAPDLVARSHEFRKAIQKVLNALSVEHRAVLVFCSIQQLSYEDAGKVLGLAAGTVASRLSRAREQFNKKLRIEYDLGREVI